ncbi:YkgJ family cysteine cluster protein [Geoalkalibacter sp.]|uniref:YkgJ family cysteine cluster protein n=1 Tax=Geoalkalibacter sp. TaxID=3041440 RepID=UPI00272EB134|nr:YkgJ family cysteine cluster protein [Geoalkalibacter sp.]
MSGINALLAEYAAHLREYDAWFARCMEQHGDRIACAAGCAACCRALFDISLLDAALLHEGLRRLPPSLQDEVRGRAAPILARLQERWPDFAHPYTLNHLAEEHWEVPEEDDTPCPFLGADQRCLVYAFRPATCRLHGLPNVDHCGEIFQRDSCSRNFLERDAAAEPGLRWHFREAFQAEARLYRRFAAQLLGSPEVQGDTFIAAVPFIDFAALGAPRGCGNL